MLSTARGVQHGPRSSRVEELRPDGLREILHVIRWMHMEHVKDLRGLGYSPKEAFWLDFACLPFLPWDKNAGREMRLSTILKLYADIHRSTVGPFQPADPRAFLDLLAQRYRTVARNVQESDAGACEETLRPQTANAKETLGAQIVMQTAGEWSRHHSAFPYRLVDDL